MPLFRHLLKLACATLVTFVPLQLALAQSVLSEPDLSGMNSPTQFFQLLARDGVRGRNYIFDGATTHINGIQIGAFSRVNDVGQLDLGWTGELATPFLRGSLILGNGELMFRDGLLDTSWHRLREGSNGGFVAETFRWTNEALTQDNTATTAGDTQGNTYAVFKRQSASGAPLATLRRVTSEGVPDSAWRLDIDADSNSIRQLAVSADGSVLYVATRTDGTTVTNTLGRASSLDTLRWSTPFAGSSIALAVDAVGRAYVLGDKVTLQGATATLLRVERTGSLDSGWMPLVEPTALAALPLLRVLDDRAVVVTASATERPLVRIISLADGQVLASRAVPLRMSVVLVDAGGTVALSGDSKFALWSPTAADFVVRDISLKTGTSPVIASIKRWGAGYAVGGQFEYVYNAIRYANLMRLGADLKPDPTWRPAVTGVVHALAVDRDGGLMVGGERLMDAQLGLIRFGADGRLDPRWRKLFNAPVFAVTAANDGEVFVGGKFGKVDDVNVVAISRFLADGTLQAGWAQSAPWRQQPGALFGGFSNSDGVKTIIDAGDAGIVVTWWQTANILINSQPKLSRFSRANEGAILPNSGGLDAINASTIIQDANGGSIFGMRYRPGPATFVRLLPGTLEMDASWLPPITDATVAALSDTHLYLANGRRMLRSANSAALDVNWTLGTRSISRWLDTYTLGDALTWSSQGGAPVAIRTPSPAIAQRTAVEYFAKDLQRFFLTARAAEQQQLDAMPTQFARTGMQFGAFDGTATLPAGLVGSSLPATLGSAAGALPICRFYAPPDRGGSNTHFYGRRTDCQFLNTFSAVVDEGYDFAAPVPAALTGLCPLNAPMPVYRMFNNLAASNSGNHRYVVSQTRIDEMKARGWLDERIAFCATFATDSRGFGQW